MGKAVAEKFAGKWKQESTDNIDAVIFIISGKLFILFKAQHKAWIWLGYPKDCKHDGCPHRNHLQR